MTPEQIEIEGMRLSAPTPPIMYASCEHRDACASICLVCYVQANRPLLAQCAALLDSLLGGPVTGGGIIDEIRRVRAELAKEGW